MLITVVDEHGNVLDSQRVEVHKSHFGLEVVPRLPGFDDPRQLTTLQLGDHFDA